MKNIILATHGNLGYEFKATAELIVGSLPNIKCFGMTKEKSATQGKKELESLIEAMDESNLIILTDMYGGSSTNICTELLLSGHEFSLLTGLNLPMLLALVSGDSSDKSVSELTSELEEAGISGVINVGKKIKERIKNNA